MCVESLDCSKSYYSYDKTECISEIPPGYYCNNEICGGREKEEIERNNYICSEYTTSKVKLISYDDFNYAYSTAKNKETFYWYHITCPFLKLRFLQ